MNAPTLPTSTLALERALDVARATLLDLRQYGPSEALTAAEAEFQAALAAAWNA